ncbi:MAG: hypothetical protein K6G26_05800 [Lachnospiraceae bacterium]|nr:hypothetical protein [Lachnospiraceae bacterium]
MSKKLTVFLLSALMFLMCCCTDDSSNDVNSLKSNVSDSSPVVTESADSDTEDDIEENTEDLKEKSAGASINTSTSRNTGGRRKL